MDENELLKMIAAQLGQNCADDNSDSKWLAPFKEKAGQLTGTPWQPLADRLIASEKQVGLSSLSAFFAAGNHTRADSDPLAGHPELIEALLEPGNSFLAAFWPPEWSPLIAKTVEYRLCGIYQSSMMRRAYRTRDKSVYPVFQLLAEWFPVNKSALAPEEFAVKVIENQQGASCSALAPFLAVMLDSGNPAVTEAFRRAIYENTGTVSSHLILALFYSKLESGWKMAADLLLAAKLQEGLRQAVLESCSDGRVESFRYLMRVIADHDLFRYPSVVRAFDTWMGLGFDTGRSNTVKSMFAAALNALENPGSFQPENPRDVFIQLWARANTEVLDAKAQVEAMLDDRSLSSPVLCTALTFYRMTGYELPLETGLRHLKRSVDDPALMSSVFSCLAVHPGDPEELTRFYFAFKELLPGFSPKKQSLKHPAFEWVELQLSSELLWGNILLKIGENVWSPAVLDDLAQSMKDMPADVRRYMLWHILEYLAPVKRNNDFSMTTDGDDRKRRETMPHTPALRAALLKSLEDKSSSNRETALSILERMKLVDEELMQVENLLALKTQSIRRAALEIIRKADYPQRSAERLRASGNPEKIAAAEELAPERKQETIIDKAHGYGLYNVDEIWNLAMPAPDMAYHPKNILRGDPVPAQKLIAELTALLNGHRQDECLQIIQVMSTLDKAIQIYADNGWAASMTEQMPMPELWDGYFAAHPLPARELVHAFLLLLAPKQPEVRDEFFELSGETEEYENPGFLRAVIHRQLKSMPEFPEFASAFLAAVILGTPKAFWEKPLQEKLIFNHTRTIRPAENSEIQSVFALFERAVLNQDTLAARYHLWSVNPGDENRHVRDTLLPIPLMLKAFDEKLISRDTLRRLLLTSQESRFGLSLGSLCWVVIAGHPEVTSLIEDAVKLELERGDLPTALSKGLGEVRHLRGSFFFVRLLNALGDNNLVRGYAWGMNPDKATTFSHLLKICRPLPEDDAESFGKQLEPFRLSEKRLLEAAMYSPIWLDIIGEHLQLPGLAMAGWYFHAHLHEQYNLFVPEKESYIARYSPIGLQEFNDGAFDIDWFREAHNSVGETMFAKLYDAAKYISGGANHRRSQIFADAALGKLKESDIEENMTSKRNKEYVMAYGILPGKDFLRRYEKLARFRKESGQFGGQRQASEKLAVEIALGNLARTAGYSDVNRFFWRMESAQLAALKELFAPQPVGDCSVMLVIDENGRAEMRIEKNGKPLKSLPAAHKKNETVLELQAAVKKLRDQHSRAKKSLEEAMIREDVFEHAEVGDLISNPILGPLVSKLLWKSGEGIDFFDRLPKTPLTIAHPAGLLKSGRWSEYQKFAVEQQLVQPFKQIFRELYTLNADEKLDGMKSDRYSGYQVMPAKAMALLRTRGWTVDMESGLQKVFHKRKLIAKVSVPFEWLTPAEVEPPTLEYAYFINRATGEMVPLAEVPETFFSEIMRDLDLMVSVAHAGGVDPEASHSTVEMRAALISALIPLFKLKNVRIEKSHAFITGKFGEYHVHLGSGVCHKQAQGMLAILPVHSQTRGRLFLPFADDDPKTAEVITKILFLAEDEKIKDPGILEQIR